MRVFSSTDIIKGIARKRDSVIHYVYKTCYPDIRKMILSNGGNEQDAEDIFQEGMAKIYQKISQHGLKLSCKFGTYMYSVCRFLWLQELEKKSAYQRDLQVLEEIIDDETANNKIRENSEIKLYEKHFRELSKECQKVLNMYFRNSTMEEICVVMGYKNLQIAKDKKYRCKKFLITKIYNNPVYKQLQDEIYLAG